MKPEDMTPEELAKKLAPQRKELAGKPYAGVSRVPTATDAWAATMAGDKETVSRYLLSIADKTPDPEVMQCIAEMLSPPKRKANRPPKDYVSAVIADVHLYAVVSGYLAKQKGRTSVSSAAKRAAVDELAYLNIGHDAIRTRYRALDRAMQKAGK